MFFDLSGRFFGWEDVGEKGAMRAELRREMVALWRLAVREGVSEAALAEGLDAEDSSTSGDAGHEQHQRQRASYASPEDTWVHGRAPRRDSTDAPSRAMKVAARVGGASAGGNPLRDAARGEVEDQPADKPAARHSTAVNAPGQGNVPGGGSCVDAARAADLEELD